MDIIGCLLDCLIIDFPSRNAMLFNVAMTDSGIGMTLKLSLDTTRIVARLSIFTDLERLSVGRNTMPSSVLDSIVFDVFGTVHCT